MLFHMHQEQCKCFLLRNETLVVLYSRKQNTADKQTDRSLCGNTWLQENLSVTQQYEGHND